MPTNMLETEQILADALKLGHCLVTGAKVPLIEEVKNEEWRVSLEWAPLPDFWPAECGQKGVHMTLNFTCFGNGVVVANTTPHPITLQDIDGNVKSVPQCGHLINARMVEQQVNDLFVRTVPVADEAGSAAIASIKEAYAEAYGDSEHQLVIVGSIIAAQAYPGEVVGMTPVPGYERVAPAEKRMRCDKFTTFA